MISSVRLEGIYKDYGLADFLLNIDNLEFSNRNIQVIVGANGSGKSTLLNILAFLDRPKTGAMFFNGKVIAYSNNGINGFHKRIGYVRQFPYLFNMDVFENIALGLKIRRYSKREVLSKVNSMLSMLNIEYLKERRIKSLSGGEHQKVAIAQVLALEPEMILMDEPAANIDTQSILSIEEAIKDFYKRKSPLIIMTTHSLTQAYRMSADIISIKEGTIIDYVPENVFHGRIQHCNNGLQYIEVAKGVQIFLLTQREGSVYISIDPKDIIISTHSIQTSARNSFGGIVIKMESLKNSVRFVVDIGIEFYVVITKKSFEEMGISLNSKVYVTFKVNSVEVL